MRPTPRVAPEASRSRKVAADGQSRICSVQLAWRQPHILVRLGYPPAIVFKGDRRRYLAALQSADRGDHGPLGELLARAILDNLHKFVVPAVAGPSRLVPLPALASERISANALRVAATRGRLEATRAADGTWRSTRMWVDEYLTGRYERGPRNRMTFARGG